MTKMVDGPLTRVFQGPTAKVLDQAWYVGNMEQTIGMLAESTGLSFKTVQKSLDRLNDLGLVKHGRKIGGARTYRFNVENDLHDLMSWGKSLKLKR